MYEISKNNLSLSKLLSKSEHLVSIEGDTIVSDAKPDILNILAIDSLINIYDTSITSGNIEISGVAEFNILYSSDNPTNEIFKLSTSLPFKNSIELPEGTNSISITAETIKVDSTILNSRKLNIAATIKLTITSMQNSLIDYIENIQNSENIEILSNNITIPNFLGTTNDNFIIKEEIELPDELPEIKDILRYEYSISNMENLGSDSKIIYKCDLTIYLYYSPMEGDKITEFNFTIPISGFMNSEKLPEKCNFSTNYILKNSTFSPIPNINSLNRKFNCEISFYVESSASVPANINIISDLYSIEKKLIPTLENVQFHNLESDASEKVQLRNSIDLESTPNPKLLSCFAKAKNLNSEAKDSKMFITGDIEATMIYESNGIIESKTTIFPFEYLTNFTSNGSPIILPSANLDTLEITSSDYNKFDIKLTLNLSYKIYIPENISILKELKEEELDINNNSSITVYYPNKDDSYFGIAKRFNAKINDIFELNNLEKDSKMPRMLLICK